MRASASSTSACALRLRPASSVWRCRLPGGLDLGVQPLRLLPHAVEPAGQPGVFGRQAPDAVLVRLHALVAALERAAELGQPHGHGVGLRLHVFRLLGGGRGLDARLGGLGGDGAEAAFEVAQLLRAGGDGVHQTGARGDELLQFGRRLLLARVVALRGGVERLQFVGHDLQALAGLAGLARDRLEFALLLGRLEAVFVGHAARLGDGGGERLRAAGGVGGARAHGRELGLEGGKLRGAVVNQHAPGERTGDGVPGRPDLDAAVGVEDRALARDHGAAGGQGVGHGVKRLGQEDVAEQAAGGVRERGRGADARQQRFQPRGCGGRRGRRRASGHDEPRGAAAAGLQQRADQRARLGRTGHHHGVNPRPQRGLDRQPQFGRDAQFVCQRPDDGGAVDAQRIGGIEKLARSLGEIAGGLVAVGEQIELRAARRDLRLDARRLLLRGAHLGRGGRVRGLGGGEAFDAPGGVAPARLGLEADLGVRAVGLFQRAAELAVLGGEPFAAQQALALARLHLGELVLDGGGAALALNRVLAQTLDVGAGGVDRGAVLLEAPVGRGQRLFGRRAAFGQGGQPPGEIGLLRGERLDLAAGGGGFARVALGPGAVLGDALFVDADDLLRAHELVVGLGRGLGQLADAVLDAQDFGVDGGRALLGLGHGGLPAGELRGEGERLRVEVADADVGRGEAAARDEQVEAAQAVAQLAVLLGLAGLALERADLAFDLADHVGQAQQVGVGLFELVERLLAVGLELGDAGGLLEDAAPVLGLGGEDHVDLALGHDRVAGGADARAHEQAVDVAQAAGRLVEEVVALAGAEDTAGDGDLVELRGQHALAVGEGDADFGEAQGLARVGAAEDHVLHLRAAQRRGTLLAEHPADGVGDVALAAAVGADDRHHAGFEHEAGPVGEALEPVDFQRLQVHAESPRRRTRQESVRLGHARWLDSTEGGPGQCETAAHLGGSP
jgi:hypothetical protein